MKYTVGKDYFDTTGIPIIHGHGFRSGDDNNSSTAVIVSEQLVRDYWQGRNPLGRRIQIQNAEAFAAKITPGSMDYRPVVPEGSPRTYEVIGVAGDVANDLLINKKHPAVYFPLRNADVSSPSLQGITLIVRATRGSNILAMLRQEISSLDANAVPFDARSMNEHIADFIAPLRSAAWTYGVIGIFGMVLASVGLAGMTAYSVVQRRREIGIRMALGARKVDVVMTVMKQGMLLIGIGATIGLGCAWAGSRMLSAMNSSIGQVTARNASDPIVLFGAPLLVGSVALLSCYLPARKSSRVEPLLALHEE
jgi:putative ABC transport system permease protein